MYELNLALLVKFFWVERIYPGSGPRFVMGAHITVSLFYIRMSGAGNVTIDSETSVPTLSILRAKLFILRCS